MKKIVALLLCALFITVSALAFTSCSLIKEKLGLGDSGDDVSGDGGDVTVKENFKVSFKLENGSDDVEQTYEIGSKLTAPETPTRAGYTFLGWYNGEVKWDFENDVITGPVELKAKWSVIVYNIVYDLGDGVAVNTNPNTFDVETGDITLSAAKRENYIFEGWYLDAEFTERVDKINASVLADVTLYAKWSSVTDYFEYEINELNKATLTSYNGSFDVLNIPETIDGYEINELGENLFAGCTTLLSVSIPDTVETIGDLAFAGCENLVNVTFGSGVKVIGEKAFYLCVKIVVILIPDNVTEIGIEAFSGCSGAASITVGNGVTSIGNSAFANCSGATSLTLGDNVTSIGENAFYLCIKIVVIVIPDSVTEIGSGAFSGCSGASSITVGDGVTSIGNGAFANCSGATSITVGNKVTNIGESAFAGCSSATSVTLGDSVQSIGKNAFYLCIEIVYIIIPESVTFVGENAFGGCENTMVLVFWTEMPLEWAESWLGDELNKLAELLEKDSWEFVEGGSGAVNMFGAWYVFKEETCAENGELRRDYLNVPGQYQSKVIPATGDHDYQYKETVAPDCDDRGYDIYECTVCHGTEDRNFVDELGHSDAVLNTVAPECEARGYTVYKCSVCEREEIRDYVDALGHTYVATNTVAPTCENAGYTDYECSVCHGTKTDDYVDALGHKYSAKKTVAPTCTEEGYTVYRCSVCRTEYSDNYVDALGHDYNKEVVDPTCLEGGYTVYTCKREGCGYSFVGDETDALGHDHQYAETVAPTCETSGYSVYECSRCDDSVNRDYVSSLGHDALYLSTVKPTCTTGGYDMYFCKRCEKHYNGNETQSLGHDYSETGKSELSCTTAAYTEMTCNRCGGISLRDYKEALGHDYVNSKCETCGDILSEGLSFKKYDNGYYVNGLGYCENYDIVIPATYEGLAVLGVASGAFKNNTLITSVVFPEGMTVVESDAFSGCTALKSITIPTTMQTLGRNAFYDCTSVEIIYFNAAEISGISSNYNPFGNTGESTDGIKVIFGSHVKTVPYYLFSLGYTYSAKVTEVVFEKGSVIEELDTHAFAYTPIKSITIPATVKTLGYGVFYNCYELEEIRLEAKAIKNNGAIEAFYGAGKNGSGIKLYVGAEVTAIPEHLFYSSNSEGCANVTSVEFSNSGVLTKIGQYAFHHTNITELVIPESVATIGEAAFTWCSKLESVVLPDNLSVLPAAMFSSCQSLVSVNLPKGMTALGGAAFSGCSSLSVDIIIPEGFTKIENGTFSGCSSLKNISLPSTLKEIGDYAFNGCSSLESIVLPEGLLKINDEAFRRCTALSSITIPDSVTLIGGYAFCDCSSLETVNINVNSALTTIKYEAFEGSGVKTITIPKNVTSLDGYLFQRCESLNEIRFYAENVTCSNTFSGITGKGFKIFIGNTVLSIPDSAFSNVGVAEVEFEANSRCKYIGEYAFRWCESLQTIIIPASVETIGNEAFYYCSKLSKLTFEEGSRCEIISDSAFSQCRELVEITIPKSVKIISNYAFQSCKKLEKLSFADGSALESIGVQAFMSCQSLVSVAIPDSVTSIGDNAFAYCTSLVGATLPENLEILHNYVFNECEALVCTFYNGVYYVGTSSNPYFLLMSVADKTVTTVEIPSSTRFIGDEAFKDCVDLQTVKLPEGLLSIGKLAFAGCTSLVKIDIPSTVTTMREQAFANCSSLTEFCIPESVTTIETSILFGCSSLTRLTFPTLDQMLGTYFGSTSFGGGKRITHYTSGYSVAYYVPQNLTSVTVLSGNVGYSALSNCSFLTEIVLGEGVTTIGNYALYGCSGITSIEIPDGVTYIGGYAFAYCSQLTELTIPESVTEIGGAAFGACVNLVSITVPFANIKVGSNSYPFGYFFGQINYGSYISISQSYYLNPTATSSSSGAFYIPATLKNVTVIGGDIRYGTFYNMHMLESITLLDGVVNIENGAFYRCTGLKSLVIGNNSVVYPMTLANMTFDNMTFNEYGNAYYLGSTSNPYLLLIKAKDTSITSCDIHESTVYIHSDAFKGCSALESITLTENITYIGNRAFEGCTGLKEIRLESVGIDNLHYTSKQPATTQYSYPFYSTVEGEVRLTVGKNVPYIPDYLFYQYAALGSIEFEEGSICESIGQWAFYSTGITTVSLPESLSVIGEYAFRSCRMLEAIMIPSSTRSVDIGAFYDCNKISSLTIEGGDVELLIGTEAFYGLTALTELTIPARVTSVGSSAFSNCTKLAKVTFEARENTLSIGNYAFSGSISAIKGVYVDDISTWLNIKFVGETSNPISKGAPLYIGGELLQTIDIPEGTKSISPYAFFGYSSLKEITIPNSVTGIGSQAFGGCVSLQRASLPASFNMFISLFGTKNLSGTTGITLNSTTYYVPNSLTSVTLTGGRTIASYAFYKMTALKSITIADTVTYIGSDAFNGCTSLGAVYYEGEVDDWFKIKFDNAKANPLSNGASLYSNGELVTVVETPDGITTVAPFVFYGCKSITELIVSDSAECIDQYAFAYCTNLKSITLGESLKTLVYYAFYECTLVQTVNFNAVAMDDFESTNRAFERVGVSGIGVKLTVGKAVTKIPAYAFYSSYSSSNNIKLVSVEFEDGSVCESIGLAAFYENRALTTVILPDSISSIGSRAFTNCISLASIVIPKSVTVIDDETFSGCAALLEIDIPLGITEIGDSAFAGCRSLRSVTIPESVTKIGNFAFSNCVSVNEIIIPDSVTYLGVDAFDGCTSVIYTKYDNAYYVGNADNPYALLLKAVDTSITSCTIHPDTKMINSRAFTGCAALKEIVIPDKVISIGNDAFRNCRALESVTLGNALLRIESNAFNSCISLKDLTFGNSLEFIGYYAFVGCNSLKTVSLPDSLKLIDSYAFQNCSGIETLELGNGVVEIRSYAFTGCSLIKSIALPDSFTTLGEYAFQNCTALESLTIGSSLNVISRYAFYGCSSLTSLIIPDNVTNIENYAFYNCTSLTELSIGNGIETIGYYAFYNASGLKYNEYNGGFYIGNESNPYLVLMKIDTQLTSFETHKDTRIIYDDAFSNCANLQNVVIGENVKSFGNNVFYGCRSLSSITISADSFTYFPGIFSGSSYTGSTSISSSYYGYSYLPKTLHTVIISGGTHIADSAFNNMTLLNKITLPASIKSIGENAFQGCTGLSNVYYEGDVTAWLGIEFANETSNPLSAYYYSYQYGGYFYIEGEQVTDLVIPEGVTTIGDYAFKGCKSISKITIPKSVTHIGKYAFANCPNVYSVTFDGCSAVVDTYAFYQCTNVNELRITDVEKWCNMTFVNAHAHPLSSASGRAMYLNGEYLNTLVIPAGVKEIKPYAFYRCSTINSLTVPSGATSIGISAFYHCSGLKSVVLPDSVTSIDAEAFASCTALQSIEIPDGITFIGEKAFRGCNSLESFNIPKGITSIPAYMLSSCYTLKEITVPDNVTVIGEYAFEYCSGLTSIVIPDSVKSIESNAFVNCSGLISVVLPKDLEVINVATFMYCSNLTTVVMGNVKTISASAFSYCSKLANVYCYGNSLDWSKVTVGSDNSTVTGASIYYYSESKPSVKGNFWHFDTDGSPVAW